MKCCKFCCACIFAVAVLDRTPVFVRAVPDLTATKRTAVVYSKDFRLIVVQYVVCRMVSPLYFSFVRLFFTVDMPHWAVFFALSRFQSHSHSAGFCGRIALSGNHHRGCALQKTPEDGAHDFCLRFHYLRRSVLAVTIAHKMSIGRGRLAVREARNIRPQTTALHSIFPHGSAAISVTGMNPSRSVSIYDEIAV